MKDFKVLFIYPNVMMATLVPLSLSILYPCQKLNGFQVELDEVHQLLDSAELKMGSITYQELRGLQRTFLLYAKFPESEFDKIRIAEKFDEAGNRRFQQLRKVYYERYF